MPDKSTRQTLCVMPVGFNEKPTEWKDIEKGRFYIINGQHSVEASKWMMDDTNKVDKEAPDDVYKLWAEVITAATFGELVNPDTGRKFNTRDGWNPENCMLTREFIKHLGNLSYDELATLARHMLNQTSEKRKQPYPKVTVKSVSSVLDNCYTASKRSKRRKRKHLVKKELH